MRNSVEQLSASDFRRFAGHFATGVAVVTTRNHAGELFGLTMNAITSLSLEPPLYLICVANTSSSLDALMESRVFCINVLSETQREISNKFARRADRKFEGVDFEIGSSGVPLISQSLGHCECKILDAFPGGDHTIIVGQVVCLSLGDGDPLIFFRGKYLT